jgi:hypothetical protein
MSRWAHARRDDTGNISVLTLGFLVLTMLTLLVIAAATAVHMQRIRLVHLADELAVDAADALDLDNYYAGDAQLPTEDAAVQLAHSRMLEAVQAHVGIRSEGHLDGVRVVNVSTPDGNTAVVTVAIVVHPLWPLEPLMPFANGVELRATGSARSF